MFQLKDELHIHLYGCLTAEDVFELGKDRWQQVPERIAWFEAEFRKAFGRPSRVGDYWRRDDGFDLLKADFLFVSAGPFAEFQARFNLMPALSPGATRQTVYNWMMGGDVLAPFKPRVERAVEILKTARTADLAWEQMCKEFNLQT